MKKIHKDFHGTLSCGFQFLAQKYGKDVLDEYLKEAGINIYQDLIEKIKKQGLSAIEEYWNYIFNLEQGDFQVKGCNDKEIILKVKNVLP